MQMKAFYKYITLKRFSLFLILLLGIWAFLPESKEDREIGSSAPSSEDIKENKTERKYTLRIYPGNWYLPGMVFMDAGKPIENLSHVARKFEALYPDTKIELVGVPAVREWLVTQISGGTAPDILHVNVEEVWQDAHKGWYIPLDEYLNKPNPYIEPGKPGSEKWWDLFKYQAITRGKSAPDGKMYCISMDMIETGIFYNKDIFQSLGLSPPNNWSEFIEIQEKLKKAGYIPFAGIIAWMADWGVDLVFDQLYYPILDGIDLKKEPEREQYLQGYLDWDEICFLHSKGFFTASDPRYIQLWRILKDWRQYWNKDIITADVLRLFVTQKSAMLWNASMLVHKLTKDPQIDFEWGIFYPPPIDPDYHEFCDGHTMCVIGGAATQLAVTNSAIKDTNDPASSERLKRCIAFLQFLTTPENTELVVNEIVALLPNINGVEPHTSLLPFHEFLQRRYTTTKLYYTFDLKFNEIMLRMLGLYLNEGITEEEYLAWMEGNLEAAIINIRERKQIDFSGFEEKWRELEPVRKGMKHLPHEK